MLEKKFREVLYTFLKGESSALEITWLLQDLHKRRERRDLFVELVEEFLTERAGPERRASDQRLRALLSRALLEVDENDLQMAMPRRGRPFTSYEAPAEVVEEEMEEPDDSGLVHASRAAEVVFEKPAP